MNRLVRLFAAVAILLVAALAGMAIWQRQVLAERIAVRAAAWIGLEQVRLKVVELDSGRAVFADVQIGAKGDPDLTIDRLVLTYDAAALRQSRAKHIDVTGLRLAARWREGKISFGSLDSLLLGGNRNPDGVRLPFDSLSLSNGTIDIQTPRGTTSVPVQGTIETSGGKTADTLRSHMSFGLDLDLDPNGAEAPLGLTARGDVAFDLDMEKPAGKAPTWTVAAIADIASLTIHNRAVAPLRVSGKATLAENIARFAAKAADAGGLLELNIEGHHDIAGNSGEIAFHIVPFSFTPEHQPQMLLPFLRGQVTSVAGKLELTGNANWRESVLTSGLTLSYSGGALSTQLAEVSGIDANVTLDSLWPPSTPPGQMVRIVHADLGMPLTDIAIRFQVLPEGTLLVENAVWPWAGGVIETHDVRLTPGAQRHDLTLDVRGVKVAHLLHLADLEGLEGTGQLEGHIPIEVIGTTPFIRKGRLSTGPGGGVISYVSESTDAALRGSGAGGELLADALKNFHYTEVVMEMDGETTGPVNVRLRVAGANPDLYDGHPIELNINVEGDIGQMLRAGTAGTAITDGLRRHIEGRRLGEPK